MALRTGTDLSKGLVGEDSLPGYGPVILVKRPVRSLMQGVGGAGGEKPQATRSGLFFSLNNTVKWFDIEFLSEHVDFFHFQSTFS